jgi:hypothetical protein
VEFPDLAALCVFVAVFVPVGVFLLTHRDDND